MKNVLHHRFYKRQTVLKFKWENASPVVRPILAVYLAEGIDLLVNLIPPGIYASAQENSLLFQC